MPRLRDLDSPELSVLLGLAEDGPLNMRGFTNAAGVAPTTARAILARLDTLGLVQIERETRGATDVLTIALSPLGRSVASHVRQIDALLEGRGRRG